MFQRFHKKLGKPMVVIQPGEYYVTKKDEIIATVLGSCISVCIKDEKNQIAGMNHFMLPGDFAMEEVLISQSPCSGQTLTPFAVTLALLLSVAQVDGGGGGWRRSG